MHSREIAKLEIQLLRAFWQLDNCASFSGAWMSECGAWRFTETPYSWPMPKSNPLVAIIMGSKSDWETMRHAVETLDHLGVPSEARGTVRSSHPGCDGGFCAQGSGSRLASDHCRRGWRGAFGWSHCCSHLAARSRCSDSIEAPRTRLAFIDCPNAGWYSRRHVGDRRSRCKKRRASRRGDSGHN